MPSDLHYLNTKFYKEYCHRPNEDVPYPIWNGYVGKCGLREFRLNTLGLVHDVKMLVGAVIRLQEEVAILRHKLGMPNKAQEFGVEDYERTEIRGEF